MPKTEPINGAASEKSRMVAFKKLKEISLTLAGDLVALIIGWYLFYFLRFELGLTGESTSGDPPQLLLPAIVIAIYWVLIFTIFGLYRKFYLISRFDEIIRVAKITIIGTLILFFLLFIDTLGWTDENLAQAKTVTFVYWLVVFGVVGVNRLTIRSFQKWRAQQGKGLHQALIVGTGPTAETVYQNLKRNPTLGMSVRGFISANGEGADLKGEATDLNNTPEILGNLTNLKQIIAKNEIEDVIVALEDHNGDDLIRVLDQVDQPDVSVKILPDFHQVISGLNQTNQIFGLPLIEVMPDPMPTWEKFVKRGMDILLATLILTITLPIVLILIALVKIDSSGPAFYKQLRVGKYGREFNIYKFRTMYQNAEKQTGPMWAEEDDPRITPVGYWLRKLRLDEIPQLLNVLKGEMSLVGPRPERPYFVEKFRKEIPLYSRRLRVKPGITGWAQVKWKYDSSFEDVKEKTKYDLFYVENMSLRMDMKILINTIYTVFAGKGQ